MRPQKSGYVRRNYSHCYYERDKMIKFTREELTKLHQGYPLDQVRPDLDLAQLVEGMAEILLYAIKYQEEWYLSE